MSRLLLLSVSTLLQKRAICTSQRILYYSTQEKTYQNEIDCTSTRSNIHLSRLPIYLSKPILLRLRRFDHRPLDSLQYPELSYGGTVTVNNDCFTQERRKWVVEWRHQSGKTPPFILDHTRLRHIKLQVLTFSQFREVSSLFAPVPALAR